MPNYEYNKDYPFAAFITNLGKYNEGELVGEWVKFPTTAEELKNVFERIGIGAKDDFGAPYEEWFISDYDCYVDGLYDKLGECANPDELNYLASKLDEMRQYEYDTFQAAMELGDHTGSIQDLINLTENLDCYDVLSGVHDHDDLGRYYIEELGAMQVPEHLQNYIDYEAYGRDIALEENGAFTDSGYVYENGKRFEEVYDGDRESIPEEYRVMGAAQDMTEEATQEEIPGWAMDIAYDMDEFFRQHDPQYAAEHPEPQAAKEDICENLMAGRIAAFEEKLAALGQTPEDYLPSEIEKFKDATGYEEFLDIDVAALREALQNPDQAHIDEMLAQAVEAEREYVAEIYGQAVPEQIPQKQVQANELAASCDTFFRDYSYGYGDMFPKEEVQRMVMSETILNGDTHKIKNGLLNVGRENGLQEEAAPLIAGLDAFEREYDIPSCTIYQLKDGDETRNYRFEGLAALRKQGLSVDPENYIQVYSAPLTPSDTLETIFFEFNEARPDDFKGHSLSTSDIIVLREHGKETAQYCDSFGFSQVPEFLNPAKSKEVSITTPDERATAERITTPRGSFRVTDMSREQMEAAGYGLHHQSEDRKYLVMGNGTRAFAIQAQQQEKESHIRTAEMTVEDDYGMIDGIINNGRRGEELDKAKEDAKRSAPEKKPSIKERLAEAKKESAQLAQAKKDMPHKKSPELGEL